MTGFIGGGQLGANFPMEPHGLRVRSGRRRVKSKSLQQYADREHALICNGARSDRLCIRPASLLRDRRRGLRPVLELGNHHRFDGRSGHHDGNLAANGVGRGRRDRIRGHAERDPSPRISLLAVARQHAKFRDHDPGNLQRARVQHYRSGGTELQIRLGWVLSPFLRWQSRAETVPGGSTSACYLTTLDVQQDLAMRNGPWAQISETACISWCSTSKFPVSRPRHREGLNAWTARHCRYPCRGLIDRM
jgi:hypothetical protein